MADSDGDGESQSVASSRHSPAVRVLGGVLAILSGILYFIIAVTTLLQGPGSSLTFASIVAMWLPVVIMISSGALLAVGGIVMLWGTGGRGLVIAGCAMILALAVLGFVGGIIYQVSFEPVPGAPLIADRKVSSTLAFMAPAIIALLLALLDRVKSRPITTAGSGRRR